MSHPLIKSWQFSWAAEGRSPRTMREMVGFVERFEAVLTAEDRDLMTATRGECEAFLAGLGSPSRRQWGWRSLRSFYRLVSEELEQPSPMARVKSPKVPLGEVSTASDDDVAKLLKTCAPYRTVTDARDAALISLLWATGLRRSELTNLRLDDIDIDSLTLVVRTSKTGRSRRVPFDAKAGQHLLRYLAKRTMYPVDGGGWLWVGKKGALTSDGVRQMIERRRRVAGVSISSHSFRRGLAARALRSGVSQASLMVIAGWTTPSMPSRYLRGVATELSIDEYRAKLG